MSSSEIHVSSESIRSDSISEDSISVQTFYDSLCEDSFSDDSLFDYSVVFLTEVIDSLERGYKEKTKADYLILEINSSRYAYNMSLSEVNFYVVKAVLNLYPIKDESGNVLTAFNEIFAQLHGVLKNYIRGSDAMIDCLKAIEVCYNRRLICFIHCYSLINRSY